MAGASAATYAVGSGADLSAKGGRPILISPDGTRLDGRSPLECRPPYMRTEAVTAAAGSAYAEFGPTKVMVSVYGPRESKKAQNFSDQGRLNCDVKFTTFATSSRGKAGQAPQDKELSSLLHKALEAAVQLQTFPKTTVDVFALILQAGGAELPVLISCASLALADAGIVMYDIVTSVSVSCVGQVLLLDSSAEEERWEDGGLVVSYMPARNEITQFHLTGEWTVDAITRALNMCLNACNKLGDLMRTCLREAEGDNDDA